MTSHLHSGRFLGPLTAAARIAVVMAIIAATFGGPNALPSAALRGLPQTDGKQGDAFVEAWLAFRRDLDSLSQSGAHPGLLAEWLREAPVFLVQDAARLATYPQIVLAAVARLAELGGRENLKLIGALEARYAGGDMAEQLAAYRIIAGDGKAKKEAIAALDGTWPLKRLEAAIRLAQANDERGLAFLHRAVQSNSPDLDAAARALGRHGAPEDAAFLARASKKSPDDASLAAAAGESLMLRHFPYHHRAIVYLEPQPRLLSERDGLYETWFDALGRAIRDGARSPREIADRLEEMKKHPTGDGDKETIQRRLAALMIFWSNVDTAMAETKNVPDWPGDFGEAMQAITGADKTQKGSAKEFVKRVSAEIRVIGAIGQKLGYGRLAEPNAGLRTLTPGGTRALDDNLATAFHAVAGSTLILEWDSPQNAEALWLMNYCPYGGGSGAEQIEVAGSGAGTDWSISAGLEKETRYFQKVPLPGEPAKRLAVRILETSGKDPACIAELRLR